jgi:hypothetical protein
MQTSTDHMKPNHRALAAGVVVDFAWREVVAPAGSVPAPLTRH